jgi:peptide/nickel transport system ATP-binding protein
VSLSLPTGPGPGGPDRPAGEGPLLTVAGLSVVHHATGGDRPLVTDVSFDIRDGETIGLVGESGSGKTLTARAIVSLLASDLRAAGSIRYAGRELVGGSGRVAAGVRGRQIGYLMQDPFTMLNPMMTAGAHVAESLRHDPSTGTLRGAGMRDEVARRLAEVGIADRSVADRYPFELSGGMSQRVALAASLAGNPRLLVADEPTTALDATTQREILDLLLRLQRQRGMSLLLITHDLRLAFTVCRRIMVMYAGSIVETAPSDELRIAPAHPYSRGLMEAVPSVDRYQAVLSGIPGTVPPVSAVLAQCGFATRCPHAVEACRRARPPLLDVGTDRRSACIRLAEIGAELARPAADGAAPGTRDLTADTAAALLRVEGLHKRYRTGRTEHDALGGVSFELRAGERLGIVGESGSGKTTIARCVLGLTRPTAGRIVLEGIDVGDYRALRREDERRARQLVQCVFQDPYQSLNPMHSIGYALREALAHRAAPPTDAGTAVADLLGRVGLPASLASRRPAALSGGQRQRVAIARALAVEPHVLVCDEPVAALDVSIQAQVLGLLRDINRETGASLLFITHDLGVVRQVAERILVLHRGIVVEAGPTDEVLDRPRDDYTRRLVASMPQLDGTWRADDASFGAASA